MERGALSGNMRPGEEIEIDTPEGKITITLVRLLARPRYLRGGGPYRAVVRVEAPRSLRIALPQNVGH